MNLLFSIRIDNFLQTKVSKINANLVAVWNETNNLAENGFAFLFRPWRMSAEIIQNY